ncbi:hypothetical protein [Shewanella colwelliana]|uniref:hypothetical protein n=1 Tax=Shewanella colwelliana TaxID=23 RepID=UPI00048C2AB2|nr:hypothetical protein [Shewanella colwelliana]
MQPANSHMLLKIKDFFNHYDNQTKAKMYSLLTDELSSLLEGVHLLGSEQQTELNDLQHKFKGICRYLKIENEIFCYDSVSKIDLLSSLYALQNLLEEIKLETL